MDRTQELIRRVSNNINIETKIKIGGKIIYLLFSEINYNIYKKVIGETQSQVKTKEKIEVTGTNIQFKFVPEENVYIIFAEWDAWIQIWYDGEDKRIPIPEGTGILKIE